MRTFETLEARQLLAADIPAYLGDGQIGEVGTLQIDHNWMTVNLGQTFDNPVVIAGPASRNNGEPLTVRVRDVDSDSFQIALDEWDYLDGVHPVESVSYLVVEGGYHQLTDGTRLIAGYLPGQDHNWESYATGSFFDTTPVLLTQIMTDSEASSATTRVQNLSNNGFEVRIQEEEIADNIHTAETIGFLAIEIAVGTTGTQNYQTFATSNNVTQASTNFSFGTGFSSPPAFFADMQTFNGGDSASVRYTSLGTNSATFFIEEEQSRDTELAHSSAETVGGLAIEPGGIFADFSAPQPSNRFAALESHIEGTDTLSVAELQAWTTTFLSEAGTLGARLDDFLAAVELVEQYEDVIGPLFTSAGQQSFAASWNGETNVGRGLARAMLNVYQGVFDAVDAGLIVQLPGVVEDLLFRSTENFPGSVPAPTDPNAIYQVQIDGSLSDEFGSPGGYDTNAARRMTGAYLAPGTIAEVIVPQELVNAGYVVRVGGHSWDLSNKNNVNRLPRVSNTFDITSTVTQVANPMGGNIYIEVPFGVDAGLVDIQFRNTIRAPFFSARSFDQTTQAEWENVERFHPGAFTDIESEHSMWTVPSKWVTTLGYNELIEIIEAHDANIQVASDYVGKDSDRHKAILYMIVDTQIRANAFSIGYPQSNYGSFSQNTIRSPLTLEHAFDKVLWHEHGHAELVTMFSGESESHVHMLAMAIGMENYGFTVQEAFANSLAYGPTNHTTSDALNSWVVMDEFLNGQNMAFQQGSYRPRGHGDYAEYVELFGLDAMKAFNRQINIEMDGLEWDAWPNGRTNHNYNDRILRLSRAAGVDVSPLFHLWGHAPSNASALASSLQAEGLAASPQIYDRMLRARNEVPLNQAQWDSLESRIGPFLNNARGPWEELNANYDVARAQAAVSRIDELIAIYFPAGRPPESPLAGDFDIDLDVDGSDFLLWQRDLSVGELTDWQADYGNRVLPPGVGTEINLSGLDRDGFTTDIGTAGIVVANVGSQTETYSYTVLGLDIADDGTANDTVTFSFDVEAINGVVGDVSSTSYSIGVNGNGDPTDNEIDNGEGLTFSNLTAVAVFGDTTTDTLEVNYAKFTGFTGRFTGGDDVVNVTAALASPIVSGSSSSTTFTFPQSAFTVTSGGGNGFGIDSLSATFEVSPTAAQQAGVVGDFDLDDDVDGADFLHRQLVPSVGLLSDWSENYGCKKAEPAAMFAHQNSIIAAVQSREILLQLSGNEFASVLGFDEAYIHDKGRDLLGYNFEEGLQSEELDLIDSAF